MIPPPDATGPVDATGPISESILPLGPDRSPRWPGRPPPGGADVGWAPGGGPAAATGMWIWITDDQAELVRLRSVARSERRFSAALLVGGFGALAALRILTAGAADPVLRERLALAALGVYAGTPLLLVLAHLRWWWASHRARRLDRRLFDHPPALMDRARRRRALERALVAGGWLALLTAGRLAGPILVAGGLGAEAALARGYGTWAWLLSAVVTLALLGHWVRLEVQADPDPAGEAADRLVVLWDPLATTMSGAKRRRVRWTGWVCWALAAGGGVGLHAAWLGVWTPQGATWTALLAVPAAALLVGTWTGWSSDRRERRAAAAMPRSASPPAGRT